jgi:membrane associated rhomboid family serine protease
MGSSARSRLLAVGLPLAAMWVSELLDWALPINLDQFGIRPRHIDGAEGILFAPFLHVGWGHLVSNTVPFIVLAGVLALQNVRRFGAVFVATAIGSGLGTWLIGPSNSVHLGASGVVFGLLGYLLARGLFDRQVKSLAIGVAMGFLYGGLVWGVLPQQTGVSWQAHLFGFVAGIATAAVDGKRTRRARTTTVAA